MRSFKQERFDWKILLLLQASIENFEHCNAVNESVHHEEDLLGNGDRWHYCWHIRRSSLLQPLMTNVLSLNIGDDLFHFPNAPGYEV
jgi:hypothetical protein